MTRAFTSLASMILPFAALLSSPRCLAGAAETNLRASLYGAGSAQGELAIDLAREPDRIRITGCTPGANVLALFSAEATQVTLSGGVTLLVDPSGRFGLTMADGDGCAELDLPQSQAISDLRVQAFSRLGAGAWVASAGLRLERIEAPESQPVDVPAVEMPPVLVEEIGRLIDARLIEQALETALNSTGDSVGLDLGGTLAVPVYPCITVGGQVAFKVQVSRGADLDGVPCYDLSVGADVAGTAGVGAGVAGAGVSMGCGQTLIWRFLSPGEVTHAVRCFAILLALGTTLDAACVALDAHVGDLEDAVDTARGIADRARAAVRAKMPWRNNRVVKHVHSLVDAVREQRRARFDAALDIIEQITAIVADAGHFIASHHRGIEMRATSALEAKVGVGNLGDAKSSGEWSFANFGAALGGSIRREYSARVDHLASTGRVELTLKSAFTKTVAANLGCVIGAEVGAKRVLELSSKVAVDGDGLRSEDCGTTIKLSLDARLMGALGFAVAGKYGVGGEISAEMALDDLLAYGADAAEILLGDDDAKVVRLLRSMPITFKAQGRIESELVIGIGVKIEGAFEAGVGGVANFTDRGTPIEFAGLPTGDRVRELLRGAILDGSVQTTFDQVERETGVVLAGR